MKDNKLIAEFMGIVFPKLDNVIVIDNVVTKEDELQYHTSWDWLMPVIEEIDHLQRERIQSIEDALSTRCIGDVYNAVVEFIREYRLTPKEVV